jgi:CRISPR-associated protein Cas1
VILVDLTVISLIESGSMESKDFIRTENYNLRLKPTGASKVVNEFSNMLNKKVSCQEKESSWGYVIFLKVRELAHYLISKKEKLDFVKPECEIERIDSYDMRQKILNISYVDWKKLGFSKGTLHYMKQNVKSDKPFTLNAHVLERVNKWEASVSGQK